MKAIARVAIGVGDNRPPAMRGLLFPKIIIFDSALLLQFAALFTKTIDDEPYRKNLSLFAELNPSGVDSSETKLQI